MSQAHPKPAPSDPTPPPKKPQQQAKPKAAQPSVGAIETRQTALLIGGALVLGLLVEKFVEPTPWVLFTYIGGGSILLIVASFLVPGRLKETVGGFRFTATLLIVLALGAAAGTLILQNKPEQFYAERYQNVAGIIGFFHLDDLFHSLWFGGLLVLFVTGLTVSSLRRLPVTTRNLGFHVTHLGIILSLLGAGISATLSVRGRVDLRVGREAVEAREVSNGMPTGRNIPLGFGIRLDDFGVDHYEAEYRMTFYERQEKGFRMKASFDPVPGEKHRLPGGASYVVKAYYPDFFVKQKLVPDPAGGEPQIVKEYATASQETKNPAVVIELTQNGQKQEELLLANNPRGVPMANESALAFERRSDSEVKTFKSTVTAAGQGSLTKAEVTVNDPFTFKGWMFYQANYDPRDPTYSGLDAVKDPGVLWVFIGFGLICFGVFYTFNVAPQLRRQKAEA